MFYVYVLLLSNGKMYIGYTADLKRRIAEHKNGKSVFTKNFLPFKLIHYEAFANQTDARRRERYLKTSKGKATLKMMLKETLS
jgi:putative endonuclease